ncbi:hypothetical protein [Telmatospirillum sp. J64-1]|uniref:hypothetical protein n=1 Tax=Telmatospirillum sp. J64-1 TaxID=2502183 RepID=UPI00115DBE64|nr:hypothetical protein [Telmatospirillum sp. J64-1]
MSQERRFPPRFSDRPAEPFASAEEAWLWYARCQIARLEGARYTADAGNVGRPCEPDDIYRAVDGLYRRNMLDRGHLGVLGRFGSRQSPPDPWAGDEETAARLWGEALDRLATVLRGKGIVQ